MQNILLHHNITTRAVKLSGQVREVGINKVFTYHGYKSLMLTCRFEYNLGHCFCGCVTRIKFSTDDTLSAVYQIKYGLVMFGHIIYKVQSKGMWDFF